MTGAELERILAAIGFIRDPLADGWWDYVPERLVGGHKDLYFGYTMSIHPCDLTSQKGRAVINFICEPERHRPDDVVTLLEERWDFVGSIDRRYILPWLWEIAPLLACEGFIFPPEKLDKA